MKRFVLALLFAVGLALTIAPAQAKARQHHARTAHVTRPGFPWCGWFLRQVEHVADPRYNRALAWLHYGTPAPGPAVGTIVVWNRGHGRGHVGKIVGRTEKGWVVLSGNDGGRVRSRVRSVSNAAGFRWPPQHSIIAIFDG